MSANLKGSRVGLIRVIDPTRRALPAILPTSRSENLVQQWLSSFLFLLWDRPSRYWRGCRTQTNSSRGQRNHGSGWLQLSIGQDVASRLRTEMSSSRSGQWMPMPLPMSRQLLRCSAVPCKRRGNQARGAETVRPSERRRTSSASDTCTSITSDDTLLAKMLIPLQPKHFPVFLN